ncbi:MAG: aldehyde dehydrogenase family protein [Vicinamibacterales bacterium]
MPRYYAEAIDKVFGEIALTADDVLALIHREAVCGRIVPWNFRLMIGAWKVAPAPSPRNSVVLAGGRVADSPAVGRARDGRHFRRLQRRWARRRPASAATGT